MIQKVINNIIAYKNIIIIIILLSIPSISFVSWINGDQSRIVNEYITQSNSKIAINIRREDFSLFRISPLYIPLLINNINEKERADLLTRTFQKELMRDSVNLDLPSEFGISYFFTDKVINFFQPLNAHSNNDNFGTITCKIGDNSILVLNRTLTEPHIIFVISQNTDILEIEYENLEYNNIRLIGKQVGTTEVEVMLITSGGTKFEKKKVKVK
jgi:hypothetical protein